jgi:heavy metal translocating P-type ATPase
VKLQSSPIQTTCTLCATPVKQRGYSDNEHSFCCAGCHAVYQILACQAALVNYKEHPLFQQALRSGLISNPDLIEQMRAEASYSPDEEYKKLYLEIQAMWCPSCAQVISLILLRQKGVRTCLVDYSTDLASIEYAPRLISSEKIERLIKNLGYQPHSLENAQKGALHTSLYIRFIVAAFCSLNLMMFSYPIYASYFDAETLGYAQLFAWLSGVGAIPVLTYSAWPIWRRFYSAMRVGIWGMETLVMIGVMAALGLSVYELGRGSAYVYFDSMTVIIVFVLLGKILESRAKFSAKDSLIRLTRGLPRRGRKKFTDGSEEFLSIKEIAIGDCLVALTGEKIVLDGIVKAGEGICDESLMTGESRPIFKQKGATVLAGSIVQQGRLEIQVTATADETALQRIIAMVEQDIGHKSQYVRVADRIVKWFVPIVVTLAFVTALYCWLMGVADAGYTVTQTALTRAISVLLISCPCAIGIAAPLAESHVLNAFSKIGAIVRNRGCLAFFGKESVFFFDKTGTITEGKFKVLKGIENLDFSLQMALKALVMCSNHPIAAAINQALLCLPAPMEQTEELVGRGIRGYVGKELFYLGSTRFLKEQGILIDQVDELTGIQTDVFFAHNHQLLAHIKLGDSLKADAQSTVAALKPVKTWLVSGDAAASVQAVAKECQFDQWHAECHPLQKREWVNQLRQKGEIVVMLGDGINDAPALTAAHVGIAVVSATDASIQVSDILLTTDRLHVIPLLRKIAIKGHCIVRQNLFWAFFYNVFGIGLAMLGYLSPIFAAFAMIASSLMVLLNAQRIRY